MVEAGNEKSKRGRKPRPYFYKKENKYINGLRYRQHDKRWILSDGRTFTEPDEDKAIERFRQMTEPTKRRRSVFIPVTRSNDPCDIAEAAEKLDSQSSLVAVDVDDDPDAEEVGFDVDSAAFWQYVAKEILARPKWVAEQTGIEWIAYGTELDPPEPLPTWKEMESELETYWDASAREKQKILSAWRDFKETARVGSLLDITPAVAIA